MSAPRPDPTIVIAAVVEEAGRFLVCRRQAGVHLAGFWEFPGGKQEPGESATDCLRREMREELDVDVEVGALVLTSAHEYPDRTVVLHFYWSRLIGLPRPLLGQEVRWVSRDELEALPFPPADAELIARLTGKSAGDGL